MGRKPVEIHPHQFGNGLKFFLVSSIFFQFYWLYCLENEKNELGGNLYDLSDNLAQFLITADKAHESMILNQKIFRIQLDCQEIRLRIFQEALLDKLPKVMRSEKLKAEVEKFVEKTTGNALKLLSSDERTNKLIRNLVATLSPFGKSKKPENPVEIRANEIQEDEKIEEFPRSVKNGIFPTKNNKMAPILENGRGKGDLEDVAILIDSNSLNNTQRWLKNLTSQRKSKNDLPVFILPRKTTFSDLENLTKQRKNVHVYKERNYANALSDIISNRKFEFLITVDDSRFMGVDFADFYFMGKSVLKMEESLECVCGMNERNGEKFVEKDQGDVIWWTDTGCRDGEMYSRMVLEPKLVSNLHWSSRICIRPEVSRISDRKEAVTEKMWKIDKFDGNLLKKEEYHKRIVDDLWAAEKMGKLMWEDLPEFPSDAIYMFPYSDEQDLLFYFGEPENSWKTFLSTNAYKGIIPINFDGYKIYLAPTKTYESRAIQEDFSYF